MNSPLVLALLALALLLAGCSGRATEADTAPPSVNGRPGRLRLGYTPSEELVADREQSQAELARYLERTLGIPVELVRTASYGPAIEAMERGDIDVMSLGPFAYVLAAKRAAAEAIATTGRPGDGPRTYQS
ncbi:MAG TPA: PhnD/SsuA/transferrin family substrate-binding protein, partial [Opitutaceae bacterium]